MYLKLYNNDTRIKTLNLLEYFIGMTDIKAKITGWNRPKIELKRKITPKIDIKCIGILKQK